MFLNEKARRKKLEASGDGEVYSMMKEWCWDMPLSEQAIFRDVSVFFFSYAYLSPQGKEKHGELYKTVGTERTNRKLEENKWLIE